MIKTISTYNNERGAANFFGMLAIFCATALLIAVLMLFVTGVAQRSIIPRLKARSQRAVPELVSAPEVVSKEVDISALATSAQLDSLRALKQQVRIEQEALEQRITNIQIEAADLMSKRQGADEETSAKITKMAKIYSGMKPQAAAGVMSYLDDVTFMRVFTKIKPAQASKIMSYSDPVRMARLTKEAATSVAERQ